MSVVKQKNEDYIISYFILRQLIGIIGLVLPFVLIIGNRLLGNGYWLQESISHYFYSYMHFTFVGTLCVLCAVLISYREEAYNLAGKVSTIAGFSALGVAVFPTSCEGFFGEKYIFTSVWENWFKWIHFGSAFILFSCFAFFCFVIFQHADDKTDPSKFDSKKRFRNKIYTICGWGIVVSIVIIACSFIYEKYYPATTFTTYATFIFETTALLFFGNSWLLKGSAPLKHSKYNIMRKMVEPVR